MGKSANVKYRTYEGIADTITGMNVVLRQLDSNPKKHGELASQALDVMNDKSKVPENVIKALKKLKVDGKAAAAAEKAHAAADAQSATVVGPDEQKATKGKRKQPDGAQPPSTKLQKRG